MYVPPHFAQADRAALHELIRQRPLATLIVHTADGLSANHVPLHLDATAGDYGTLRGHVARANPCWREHDPAVEVLAVFTGVDAYISPEWYASKAVHGKVVPTWNYVAVHASGPLRLIDEPRALRALVGTLTDEHEAGRARPWQVDDAPADYLARLLDAIVGIEIPIARLTGKWKLSQNQPADNRAGVVQGLAGAGAADTARMAAAVAAGSGYRQR